MQVNRRCMLVPFQMPLLASRLSLASAPVEEIQNECINFFMESFILIHFLLIDSSIIFEILNHFDIILPIHMKFVAGVTFDPTDDVSDLQITLKKNYQKKVCGCSAGCDFFC